MNKSKKIIVFLCLFFLSFSIVTDFKKQEAQAIVFVDDFILWTLGSLILASGVIAVSGEQIMDMGQMVVDRLSNLDQDLEYIRNGSVITGVKIGNNLISAIEWVSDNLTTTDKLVNESKPFLQTMSYSPTFSNSILTFENHEKFYNDTVGDYYLEVNNPTTSNKSVTFRTDISSRVDYVTCEPGTTKIKFYSITKEGEWKYFLNTVYQNPSGHYGIGGQQLQKVPFTLSINVPTSLEIIVSNMVHTIPYSLPEIKANYNPTYTNDNLTMPNEKEGYISIPSSIPTDIPISTEMPLTWDNVKDNINVIPVDNTVPGENTGENEGENEGSLDGALDDIFNPSTTKSLDFSPLYVSFSNKFPFCIPFDLARIIGDFKANKQDPIFYVDMSGFDSTKTTDAGFSIDFTKFTVLFGIVRTFILVSFVVFLAIKTRDIIKA